MSSHSTENNEWSPIPAPGLVEGPHIIGRRIAESFETRGTVRYFGSIPGSSGLWLGIEWDDHNRGRHNGNHKGHQYFTTRHPTSGSFLRPNKISFGISMEAALIQRYSTPLEYHDEIDYDSDDSRKLHIEVVLNSNPSQGLLTDLTKLTNISVTNQHVCGSEGRLGDVTPRAVELNLSRTLVHSWEAVAGICCQLPKLTKLLVNDNELPAETVNSCDSIELIQKAFINVETLVMVRLRYSWSDVCNVLEQCFPNLTSLCVAYNNITSILPSLSTKLIKLTYLDLSANELTDFRNNVLFLGQLPCLETFFLTDNKLTNISLDDNQNSFPSLKELGLGGNLIARWYDFQDLNKLPALQCLSFWENPLVDSLTLENSRYSIIARLGQISILNRNEISAEERRASELHYLRHFGLEWIKAVEEGKEETFYKEQPRYQYLVERLGAPDKSELAQRPTSMETGLLNINIDCEERHSLQRRVPKRMSVRHLQALIRRLLGLSPGSQLALSYKSPNRPKVEVKLDVDTREIGHFGLDSGDIVVVRINNAQTG